MPITLKQIESFLAVARSGGFTRASEHLNVSQSVCSAAVKELEAQIGTPLFHRTTRRVELTEAGRNFRIGMEKLSGDLKQAVRQAREVAELKRGRLAVAAPPLLAAALLPKPLAEFAEAYPAVRLSVHDVPTDQVVPNVRAGLSDLGVGTFSVDEPGIRRLRLMRDVLMAFVHKGDRLAGSDPLSWRALADRQIISLGPAAGVRSLVDLGFQSAGMDVSLAFEVAQMHTAVALAEAGLGVAVLPAYASNVARFHEVVCRPLTEPEIGREVWAIHAADHGLSPAARSFVAVLRRHATRQTPGFRGAG